MSLFSKVLNLFRSPLRYVGRDLQGNRFFERPSVCDDPRRTKRTVQYKDPEDVWKYIGGGKRLPVQWSMWLTHTRTHPPTVEELQRDVERIGRVVANAALIEARDEAERQARLRLEQSLQEESYKRAQISQPELGPSDSSKPTTVRQDEKTTSSSQNEDSPTVDIEIESWSPKTVQRRGDPRSLKDIHFRQNYSKAMTSILNEKRHLRSTTTTIPIDHESGQRD